MKARKIVLHDFFAVPGGGERLVLELARGLDMALGFAYWTQSSYPRTALHGLTTIDLGAGVRVPGLETLRLIRLFQSRTAFLADYDTAIYSGDLTPFAVTRHGADHNIWYCHTPPRLVYDQREHLISRQPSWQRPLLYALTAYMKRSYPQVLARMDRVIVNSTNVQERVKRYWQCEAEVVHPPCDTNLHTYRESEGYYLSTARLSPLKRVDLIVRAFLKMPDKRLIVTSDGDEMAVLRKLAGNASNIRFTGRVSDEQLRSLLAGAIATIYVPVEEDFGMSPVESMASGKPVIGVAEGGLLETVVHGETGLLIKAKPKVEHLIEAVEALPAIKAREMRRACEERSREFSREVFLDKMRRLVE